MRFRYMGTKRDLAHRVRHLVTELRPKGLVVDLFSGMGCVAEGLAGIRSVVTNDSLTFTGALARARFIGADRTLTGRDAIERLKPLYREHLAQLTSTHRDRLRTEQAALDGDRLSLDSYFQSAEHVANNVGMAERARIASAATDEERYCLATYYFSAGYFSLRQAIELDALRYAIDHAQLDGNRDWTLGAWLAAAAVLVNAPGHTAQYLKPNTDSAAARIRRAWSRKVWDEFQLRLIDLKLVGSASWRKKNRVETSDALELLRSQRLRGVGLVYADPPYTKDQYSRYYHVYETLYRYDFPGANGNGRVRPDRSSTAFCLKSQVANAFKDLFASVADLRIPMILSYPTAGLLTSTGATIQSVMPSNLDLVSTTSFLAEHSTLGASTGRTTKTATENLYVFSPS